MEFSQKQLHDFIVKAKKNTYVGRAQKSESTRLGSNDIKFIEGDFYYHDTYFGNNDFAGQETVYYKEKLIWSMIYFGKIIRLDLTTADEIGKMIQDSLSRMYQEGRFLGYFTYNSNDLRYEDYNNGDFQYFNGIEKIFKNDEQVYELKYSGGLIK